MMKLITNTSQCVKKLGLDETIGMMARAGFDALDWSFFDMWQETSIWRQDNWRELAARMRVSRSQLYAQALEEYLARRQDSMVTEQLDAVYAVRQEPLDPAFDAAQRGAIDHEAW